MWIDKFIKYLRYEKGYSSLTEISYFKDLTQFKDFVALNTGAFDPSDIDRDIIRLWIASLVESGVKSRSVNRKLSALKSFFKYMERNGFIDDNCAKKILSLKTEKRLPTFVQHKQLNEILVCDEQNDLATFEEHRDKFILELLYVTGMRRAELIALCDQDVDLGQRTVKVTGKRGKQRLIPFGPKTELGLKSYFAKRDEEGLGKSHHLFVRKNGEPLYPGLVYRIVKRELAQIETLSKKSPHVLRHTFATELLNNGAEINSVKELLGHSSLASTEVYTHVSFEELKKIYQTAHPRASKKRRYSMDIRIQSVNFDATDQLKSFVEKKIGKLSNFNDNILDAEVIMKVVKPDVADNKDVSVKLNIKNGEAFASKIANTFEEAIDHCSEALEKQILKAKEKNSR